MNERKGIMQIHVFSSLVSIQKVWRGTHFFTLQLWKKLLKRTSEATSHALLRIQWEMPLLWSSWKKSREVKLSADDYLPLKMYFNLLLVINSPLTLAFSQQQKFLEPGWEKCDLSEVLKVTVFWGLLRRTGLSGDLLQAGEPSGS